MDNLEQIRALNALKACGKYTPKGENDGNVVKKVPAMIQQNGLLGTIAFAMNDKKEGYKDVLSGAIEHYSELYKTPATVDAFLNWLVQQDSSTLRAATAEILAYLNYYRRFAK